MVRQTCNLKRFCNLVNPADLVITLNSIWVHTERHVCTRRLIRLGNAVGFLLVLSITGYLYARVVITLRKGRTNKRKRVLTVTFAALWLSWLVQSTPFILFDLYDSWSVERWEKNDGLGGIMAERLRKDGVGVSHLCFNLELDCNRERLSDLKDQRKHLCSRIQLVKRQQLKCEFNS